MAERQLWEVLTISDVPHDYVDSVVAGGITVRIVMQRTGFGYRRYFLCPSCSRKCEKLHLLSNGFHCHRCMPFDLYGFRRGLYDEGGDRLITWHMMKLGYTIGIDPIEYPFHYWRYVLERPKSMRQEKYRKTLLKLQILENMRLATLICGCIFTGTDIKKYTSELFIKHFDLWQVDDYLIFGTNIPPEYYGFLLDKETAPPRPPHYIGPMRVHFGHDAKNDKDAP